MNESTGQAIKKQIVLIGQATKEQIAEWKTQYERVFTITTGGHIAYLRKPGRTDVSYATTVGQKDAIKFNETVYKNCFIGGSEEILEKDELFFGASAVLDKMIEVADAELGEL